MKQRLASRLLLAGLFAAIATLAHAHGLGERYDLPLPLPFYLGGAASVVFLSCLIPLALTFWKATPSSAGVCLRSGPAMNTILLSIEMFLRFCAIVIFIIIVAAGLFGSRDPFKNPLPVSVWVLGWVGISYLSSLAGNAWAVLNPWDNCFRLAAWMFGRSKQWDSAPAFVYPKRLESWPAFVFFVAFVWLELVWPYRDAPRSLAIVVLVYSIVTWAGMAVFGRELWLKHGECFSVAFGLFSRFAPINLRKSEDVRTIEMRLPSAGLVTDQLPSVSVSAFAIWMLSTVTFDGLLETPLWVWLMTNCAAAFNLDAAIVSDYAVTLGIILFPLLFASIYLATMRVMRALFIRQGRAIDTMTLARHFVFTLVPISIGYHLSHYLSYFLIAGQFAIPIASDPFALGWNLFGTRLYFTDFSVINAQAVWYLSLVFIIAGHVLAVWLAHFIAARVLPVKHAAIAVTQLPMLVLMTFYTAVSLWILAQPITKV